MKKEAFAKIMKYGVSFRQSALHLIRKKHPGIDLSRIKFTSLEGHDLSDPDDGVAEVETDFEDVDQTEDLPTLEDSNTVSLDESSTLGVSIRSIQSKNFNNRIN